MSTRYRNIIQNIKWDADFQTNVLDVATTNGYLKPSFSTLAAANQLMKDLKSIGLYSLLDTFANFTLNNQYVGSFSLIDWKRTGVLYTTYGGLTYSSKVWIPNGVDGYIDSNFNAASGSYHYTLNNASRLMVAGYIPGTGTARLDGTLNGSNINNLGAGNSANNRVNMGGSLNAAVEMSGSGFKAIIRDNNNNLRAINKDVESARTGISSSLPNMNQLLYRNTAGYGSAGLSCFMMGASITYNMAQDFRTVYNNFLSRIGETPLA